MQYIEGLLKSCGKWVRIAEFDPANSEYDYMGFLEHAATSGMTGMECLECQWFKLDDFAALRGGEC